MKPPVDWTYFVGDELNDEGDVAGYTSAAEALRNAAESDRIEKEQAQAALERAADWAREHAQEYDVSGLIRAMEYAIRTAAADEQEADSGPA